MKENKDEQFTYEELTARCRKQEEYIKELEEELKISNETIKCDVAKPTYEDLIRQVRSLNTQIYKLEQENNALRYSLASLYIQLENSESRAEQWKEDYYRENSRAEKLYDELNKR